jgi:hypothetical protein
MCWEIFCPNVIEPLAAPIIFNVDREKPQFFHNPDGRKADAL